MTEFETLATGLRFPEGPVAMPDGSILLVEIARGTVSRVRPGGTVEVVAELGGGPNGLALGPDGALYVCNNGGFVWHEEAGMLRPVGTPADYAGGRIERVDLETGQSRVLYAECDGRRLCGPNDIVFDRAGGFYFTDLGKSRARDRDHGTVYYATCDGASITEVVHPILTPNGVGLSPDEATLYVANTEAGQLWAFELDRPGHIRAQGFPSPNGGRMLFNQAGYQRYDSLAVTEVGNVCVATLITGQITSVSPGGALVHQVDFPDPYVTNICFAGPDRRTAIITLSGSGRLVSVPWPEAGLRLNFSGV